MAKAIRLSVASAEQVVADPHNRDAILRPPLRPAERDNKPHAERERSERPPRLPPQSQLCTAFILDVHDVARAEDSLTYSIPVRYSRFERLHAELCEELPPASRAQLSPLPQKRIFAWAEKLLNQPSSPLVVEERTRALDMWVRQIIEVDGVADSQALASLIFLGVGAESAIREARAAHDEASRTQTSKLDQISSELRAVQAYAKVCRERKDLADARARNLSSALDATAMLLSRRRDAAKLAAAWRRWSGQQRAQRDARAAKEAAMAKTALNALRRRVAAAEASASQHAVAAAAAVESLAQADATIKSLLFQLGVERAALAATVRMHTHATREAAVAAEEERQLVLAQARAAEALATERLQALAMEEAKGEALSSSLADADAVSAELASALADALDACVAHRQQIASERRARSLASVRASAAQAASEERLLLLLQSQRERLAANALELAEARKQAAVATARPELEAPWLAPPPSATSAEEEEKGMTAEVMAAAEARLRSEMAIQWREEWVSALAHSM